MDNKKRILLVDDEQINLEFFDVMLTKLGFIIEKAEDGLEALEMVKRWKPDLIILDNVMPKLSGWEVTRILKSSEEYKDYSEIPIIMFSAMDDVKDKVEGLELGADDYITKPFNFSEVLARIRVVLRTRELLSQIERREEHIKVTEEIAARALEMLDGFKEPLRAIGAEGKAISSGCGDAGPFVKRAASDAETALGKLDELDETIASLKREADSLKQAETALPAIKRNLRG